MKTKKYTFGQFDQTFKGLDGIDIHYSLYALEDRVILACHYAKTRGQIGPVDEFYLIYGTGLPRNTIIEGLARVADNEEKIIHGCSHTLIIEGIDIRVET